MNCDFDNDAMTCPHCGFKAGGRDWRKNCKGRPDEQWVAVLTEVDQQVPLGLGDLTAAGLAKLGITKQRVEEWLGAPCGCAARQEKLNQVSAKVMAFLRGKPPSETPAATAPE